MPEKKTFFAGFVLLLLVSAVSYKTLQSKMRLDTSIDKRLVSSKKMVVDRHHDGEEPSSSSSSSSGALGNDCLHIYLDVGANIGVHTRFLFEPDKYPNASVARNTFDEAFGKDRDNRDFCSFGFEPNPAHVTRHEKLEEAYHKMKWRYKFINAGVSDQEGNLTFYHQGDTDQEEYGFSTTRFFKSSVPVNIPLVDFSHWLQTHILERRLPSKVYGNYSDDAANKGKVVMKMDIEGSEYIVLPSIFFSGVYCKTILDVAFGETHPRFKISRPAIDPLTGQGAVHLPTARQANLWYDGLVMKALKSVHPEDCKARWFYLDDETYLHDGIPFPTPNDDK